jgi:hypothetical protein
MKRSLLIALSVAAAFSAASDARAIELLHRGGAARSPGVMSVAPDGSGAVWNGAYYKPEWGMPVALVVPPTAEFQSDYGWGVGNFRVTPIAPQFHRAYPGEGVYNRRLFRPTPPWPSDTNQFGVYYVRGPW